MHILETIRAYKLKEVASKKIQCPARNLEKSDYFFRPCLSFKSFVCEPGTSGIIAEFKRKSPSKGNINVSANVEDVTKGYVEAGASALSILTDEQFFGAKAEDFQGGRKENEVPILRKEFMLDEYQILESKSMGADAILLIAKLLKPREVNDLSNFAQSLGLEVLLETHNEREILENQNAEVSLFGINNRNLQTFEVDIENSIRLAEVLPASVPKIAESGIESAETIQILKANGFKGFLIGEYFMRHSDPAEKCRELIKEIKL